MCRGVWDAHGVPGAALYRRDSTSTHSEPSAKLK